MINHLLHNRLIILKRASLRELASAGTCQLVQVHACTCACIFNLTGVFGFCIQFSHSIDHQTYSLFLIQECAIVLATWLYRGLRESKLPIPLCGCVNLAQNAVVAWRKQWLWDQTSHVQVVRGWIGSEWSEAPTPTYPAMANREELMWWESMLCSKRV